MEKINFMFRFSVVFVYLYGLKYILWNFNKFFFKCVNNIYLLG